MGDCHRTCSRNGNPCCKSQNRHRTESGRRTIGKDAAPLQNGSRGDIGQRTAIYELDNVVGAIHHALSTDSLRGPVNNVAPHPVTNREFTKTLGRVLRRPTLFPLPSFGLRLMFGGEMANELFLSSTRVEPARLLETGYAFQYPELEGALQHVLGT